MTWMKALVATPLLQHLPIRISTLNRISKETLWMGLSQAVNILGQIVRVKLLIAFMGVDNYGYLALGLTLAFFVSQTLTGGIEQATLRFFAEYQNQKQLASLMAVLKRIIGYIGLAVTFCGFWVALIVGVIDSSYWAWLIVISLLTGVIQGSSDILYSVFNAARIRSMVALSSILRVILPSVGAILLVSWINHSASLALMGYALGLIGALAFQIGIFRQMFRNELDAPGDFNFDILRKLFTYAWPFMVWGIPSWLQLYGDRWILQGLLDAEAVAIYTVLVQLGSAPIMIASATLSQIVSPIVFEHIDTSPFEQIQFVKRWLMLDLVLLLLVILGMTVVMWFFGAEFLRWLTTPDFAPYSNLLPWVCLGTGAVEVGRHLSLIGFSLDKSRVYLSSKVGIVIVGITLNILLIKTWELTGAVFSLLAVGIIFLVWNGVIAHRLLCLQTSHCQR